MPSPGEEIRIGRIKKTEVMRENKINPYPSGINFVLTEIAEIKENFKRLAVGKKSLGIAGRVVARREHGNSMFLDLFDGSGKFQIFVATDKLKDNSYNLFKDSIDVGDFLAFWGKAFYTKRKEPTLEAQKWQMLSKSLRPLPEKWHGLQDIEERFRKRYLDILMGPEVKELLIKKTE